MGVYSACDGGCQDIQNESSLHAWRHQDPDLDNASCPCIIRLILGAKYQLSRACLRTSIWLWLGTRIPQIPRTAREDTALDRRKDESARETATLRISGPEDIRPIRRPSYSQPDCCRSCRKRNSSGIRREHAEIRVMSDACWNHVFSTCIKT